MPVQVGFRPPVNRDFENMPVFDNYREIAKAAVSQIKENDVVYLPSGSFGVIMVSLLAVIKNSRKKILTIPNSKIGVNAFVKVCDINCFDEIITDWDCTDEEKTAICDKGINLTIVEEPK